MSDVPTNEYVEIRNRGYYVAGSRISLDSVAYSLIRGDSVDEILANFPVLSSRAKLAGAIKFIEAHRIEIDAYLKEKELRWDEAWELNQL